MNVQDILKKLKEFGMTDAEIARCVGNTAPSIITRLRNGKHATTTFERGKRIEALLTLKLKTNQLGTDDKQILGIKP